VHLINLNLINASSNFIVNCSEALIPITVHTYLFSDSWHKKYTIYIYIYYEGQKESSDKCACCVPDGFHQPTPLNRNVQWGFIAMHWGQSNIRNTNYKDTVDLIHRAEIWHTSQFQANKNLCTKFGGAQLTLYIRKIPKTLVNASQRNRPLIDRVEITLGWVIINSLRGWKTYFNDYNTTLPPHYGIASKSLGELPR